VVLGYRTLYKIENAFREMKDFIQLRPIYHRKESRVRGHVVVCVLAYLLEILFEKYLITGKKKISARKTLEMLEPIKVVVNELCGKRIQKMTQVLPNQRSILDLLGVKELSKIVTV